MAENHQLDSQAADEFVLDNPRLRAFVRAVKEIRQRGGEPEEMIAAIRPHFEELLADKSWLPETYQEITQTSGMGRDIGTWLLYRAGDASLAFSSLVVAPGVQTPVHDHLAWGLVGLYRGQQDEEVFARRDHGAAEGQVELDLAERRRLNPGDFYALLPECDIHRVRTTSDVASVSLHLLGIDNGCIWRHRFYPEEHRVEPFRSGYVNVACEEGSHAPAS